MLSIRLIRAGGEEYYVSLATEDYYLGGGEPPGTWFGSGAAALGLAGIVQADAFRRAFRGYHHATGQPLVQNAGYSDRQCAHDLTFSAPKSVTIDWSIAQFPRRILIQQMHDTAIKVALQFAERNLLFSRVGKGGAELVRVGMVASLWEHGTNRLSQAQLHTHAVVKNLGVARDGKTRALYTKTLFRHKKVLGAIYRAHLAHLLETELRLSLVRKGDSFEVMGVREDLIKFHSQRRAQILDYLKSKRQYGPIAAAEAALKTRRTKRDIPPREELFRQWQKVNADHGFTQSTVAALPQPGSRNLSRDLPAALASARDRMALRCSHFARKDFLFEVLLEAPKWGIPPEPIYQAVTDFLAHDEHIVRLKPMDGEDRYTTRAILKRESRLLLLATRLRRTAGPRADYRLVQKVVKRYPKLRPDQARAVHDLTRGKGRLRILCGAAGTGKTTTLQVARKIWRKQGFRVVGATFTGKAADVLEQATQIETQTIHRRLADYHVSRKYAVRHHLKQFLRALQGKPTHKLQKPRPIKIDSRTILVVDEASLVNTRHMHMILRRVQQGGGIAVLLGDPSQIPAFEGGAPFQSLARRTGHAELTQICRQQDIWAREAVQLFADGKPAEALRLYADHRLVTVREDRAEALQALVLDWTAVGLTTPEQAVVLVATNHESEAANLLCQAKRLEAGCLNPHDWIEVRDEDRTRHITYSNRVHVGDRILFTQNSQRYKVQNGAVGTVIGLNRSLFRKCVAVKLDNGRHVIVPVKDFPHMRLAYSLTTAKSQGVTVPEVFVLVGGPMQDLPFSYVQASRAIRDTHFYTEKALLDQYLEEVEDSALAKQMAQTPDLTLASDLLLDSRISLPPVVPSPAMAGTTTKSSTRPPRRKRRVRRRRPQPVVRDPLDQTQSMAAFEELKKRRRRLREQQLAAEALELQLQFATTSDKKVSESTTITTYYTDTYPTYSPVSLDTSSNVPLHTVLDAHFLEAALHADLLHQEEQEAEERRRQEERAEELRRQQEAEAARLAQLSSIMDSAWSMTVFDSSCTRSSSTIAAQMALSTSSTVVMTPPSPPMFDYQAHINQLAAEDEWRKRFESQSTTTVLRLP